jgi:streptogramin lyase
MTSRISTFCLWAALVVAGLVVAPDARSDPGDVTYFQLPSGQSPNYMAAGPDGNVWFTITGWTQPTGGVGKITPSGMISEFMVPGGVFDSPWKITGGPDGNVWFTEIFGGKIGRITPSGTLTEFFVRGEPKGITVGPFGDLWFVDGGTLRSITTSGVQRSGFGGVSAWDIAFGSDGNLWVTEFSAAAIARVTPFGVVTRFPLPAGTFFPRDIEAGPDGNLWYAVPGHIGRITPAGTITQFPTSAPDSLPWDLTVGSDGNMWFTDRNLNKIGRITPSGEITDIPLSAPPNGLSGITAGPDGNIWFADVTARIGRIEVEAVDNTPPVLSVPDSIDVDATSALGAVVSYIATATDLVDPNPTVVCEPASGRMFPIGDTIVACEARDASGNESESSFAIHVRGGSEQLQNLSAVIRGFSLSSLGSSLVDKLEQVQVALLAGDKRSACNQLASFLRQTAAQAGKGLTAAQRERLDADGRRISTVIGCS